MLATVKAGWTPDKGRDELDAQITIVGNDPQDVVHLHSLKDDDWVLSVSIGDADTIVLDIKAVRKVLLAEQAEAQAAAEKAAAEDAAAKAEEAAKLAAEDQAKLDKVKQVASAAAEAATAAAMKHLDS